MSEITLQSESIELNEDFSSYSVDDLASETETELESEVFHDDSISLYSAYDGSFSSTYVEYFRGYVSKLNPGIHYLCYRNGQYSYILYYSDTIKKDGDWVVGSANYYILNTYNGYSVSSGFGNVSENVTNGMYYSDLDGCPDLRGGDFYVQISLLFALCVCFIVWLLTYMYRLARHYRFRS